MFTRFCVGRTGRRIKNNMSGGRGETKFPLCRLHSQFRNLLVSRNTFLNILPLDCISSSSLSRSLVPRHLYELNICTALFRRSSTVLQSSNREVASFLFPPTSTARYGPEGSPDIDVLCNIQTRMYDKRFKVPYVLTMHKFHTCTYCN